MTRTRLVFLFCLAEVLGMAGFATFPALLPTFISRWGLSNTEAGWISGIYFAGYMGAVPILASLTDRADPRRIYLACTALGGLASLGYALFADGFWTAMFFRALAGIGLAGTYMPGLKALSDNIEGPGQSRALSFYTSSFSIGAAFSFVLAGAVGEWQGWSWAFGAAALASFAALLVALWAVPASPPRRGEIPTSRLLDFRPVLRNRQAMGYVIAYGTHIWEMFGQRSWIVAFLGFSALLEPRGSAWHVPPTIVAALVNLVGVPASIAGNELAVRYGRVRIVTFIMLSSVAVSLVIGFLASLPHPLLLAVCLLYGVLVYGDSAAITAGAVTAASTGYRGATMAVHSTFGFACGFLGPLLFGVVLDLGPANSPVAWGLAFGSLGIAASLGPVALARLSKE